MSEELPISNLKVNCGHLRVYHARGLPQGKFEEHVGDCLFCEIERVKHQRETAILQWDNYHEQLMELQANNERLRSDRIELTNRYHASLAMCKELRETLEFLKERILHAEAVIDETLMCGVNLKGKPKC